MVYKPEQQLLELLSDEWDSTNTSGVVPKFDRMTRLKSINFSESKSWVLIWKFKPFEEPAGVGAQAKHVRYVGDIDVRTHGRTQEELHDEIYEEVTRILEKHINSSSNDDVDFDIIDPDGEVRDRSDETFDVFRYIKPVNLIKYAVQRGS